VVYGQFEAPDQKILQHFGDLLERSTVREFRHDVETGGAGRVGHEDLVGFHAVGESDEKGELD
jgi:hypothetical protein